MRSINPATGALIKVFDTLSIEEAGVVVGQSHKAFLEWRKNDFEHKNEVLLKCASLLKKNKNRYAICITEEMGKPVKESEAEIEKCAWLCEYYAEHAVSFLKDEKVVTEAKESFITYQPLGVILAIMPWNFPFWQVLRCAVPIVMAGNTLVLKHASNVSGCALLLEGLFKEAGFPAHVFSTLLVPSSDMAGIIAFPHIRAVTLTGSTQAGKDVAKVAGSHIKKTVLELGGSDPYIVLADADYKKAALLCTRGRMINAGQSCIAAKRFIVVEAIYDLFLAEFIAHMKAIRMGDPMDRDTDMGPLASHGQREQLHGYVLQAVQQGAQCMLGGAVPEGQGAYYPPTVLVGVSKHMAAYKEELFGPVAVVIKAKDTAEAIAIANDTNFGLGAAIFTEDYHLGTEIARGQLDAGCCFVNDFVRSDPRLPFGGIKESGYGRELSPAGIREFVNIKAVWVG